MLTALLTSLAAAIASVWTAALAWLRPRLAAGWRISRRTARRLRRRTAVAAVRFDRKRRAIFIQIRAKVEAVSAAAKARALAVYAAARVRWAAFVALVAAFLEPLLSRLRRLTPDQAGSLASFITLAVIVLATLIYTHLTRPAPEPAPEPVVVTEPEPVLPPAAEPAAPAAPRLPYPQLGEAFVDRFDGDALHSRWFVSDGWSNGSYMENDWRADRIKLTGNGLAIELSAAAPGSDKPFSSGELQSDGFYRYGWFEFRARAPRGPGLVTGFFTYTPAKAGARSNEIDIEILGRDPRHVELTYHHGRRATGHRARLPFSASDGFHTYAFEWLPDRIRWYADGVLVHEVSDTAVRSISQPQKIYLQQWASTELWQWVGEFDPSRGPWTLDIACVAYAPVKPDAMLCE